MAWTVEFSKDAKKFLAKNHTDKDEITEPIKRAIQKIFEKRTEVTSDIKKLKGWPDGHFRIRSGKIRIIVLFLHEEFTAKVKIIDFRGDVYK